MLPILLVHYDKVMKGIVEKSKKQQKSPILGWTIRCSLLFWKI